MDMFNIICGVCSIAGLLVSVFTACKVTKISSKIINKNDKSTFWGMYVGRDNINGIGNSKQK